MQNSYFHNNKSLNENLNQTKTFQRKYIDKKKVVDINKLLNRVKANQIKEKKKNIAFIFYTFLCVSFSAYFIFN